MKTIVALAALAAGLAAGPLWAQDAAEATATANFIDVEGNEIGTATLTQGADGVMISGMLEGVAESEHGFHVHEFGVCDGAMSFETAGDHFAPQNNEHGMENPMGPHAGDMGNQTADADGNVTIETANAMVSLTEGEDGYLFDEDGSALVLHADPDDNMTDPGGNSGDRIACAVIEADVP